MIFVIAGVILIIVLVIAFTEDWFDNLPVGAIAEILGYFGLVAGAFLIIMGIFGSFGTESVLTGEAKLIAFNSSYAEELEDMDINKELISSDGRDCYVAVSVDEKKVVAILEYNGIASIRVGSTDNIDFQFQDVDQPIVERYEERPIKNPFVFGVGFGAYDTSYKIIVPKECVQLK